MQQIPNIFFKNQQAFNLPENFILISEKIDWTAAASIETIPESAEILLATLSQHPIDFTSEIFSDEFLPYYALYLLVNAHHPQNPIDFSQAQFGDMMTLWAYAQDKKSFATEEMGSLCAVPLFPQESEEKTAKNIFQNNLQKNVRGFCDFIMFSSPSLSSEQPQSNKKQYSLRLFDCEINTIFANARSLRPSEQYLWLLPSKIFSKSIFITLHATWFGFTTLNNQEYYVMPSEGLRNILCEVVFGKELMKTPRRFIGGLSSLEQLWESNRNKSRILGYNFPGQTKKISAHDGLNSNLELIIHDWHHLYVLQSVPHKFVEISTEISELKDTSMPRALRTALIAVSDFANDSWGNQWSHFKYTKLPVNQRDSFNRISTMMKDVSEAIFLANLFSELAKLDSDLQNDIKNVIPKICNILIKQEITVPNNFFAQLIQMIFQEQQLSDGIFRLLSENNNFSTIANVFFEVNQQERLVTLPEYNS